MLEESSFLGSLCSDRNHLNHTLKSTKVHFKPEQRQAAWCVYVSLQFNLQTRCVAGKQRSEGRQRLTASNSYFDHDTRTEKQRITTTSVTTSLQMLVFVTHGYL